MQTKGWLGRNPGTKNSSEPTLEVSQIQLSYFLEWKNYLSNSTPNSQKFSVPLVVPVFQDRARRFGFIWKWGSSGRAGLATF
jgi:hypothetical protein